MKKWLSSEFVTTGLAIFSMFFGAGNLMFPIHVGVVSGDATFPAMAGFIITTVLLPLAGLIAIILFQGDYLEFFYRAGRIPGMILAFICTFIIGPMIAMPRIVTLSYTMISPFVPFMSLTVFSIVFLGLTFLATYKESKIVNFLGQVISPLLLASLVIIIIKGMLTGTAVTVTGLSSWDVFWQHLKGGYETLDLLGGIFFASIVITILKKSQKNPESANFNKLALLSFKAGILGTSLLGVVYLGLSYLGAYFGHGLENINPGELFSTISFRVLGPHGAAIIAIAVLMACYSTIIALTAVYAEYVTTVLSKNSISYTTGLIATLVLTLIPSIFGLDFILEYSKPIINLIYPVIIVLTLFNILYKLFNVKMIKVPLALTLAGSIITTYFV